MSPTDLPPSVEEFKNTCRDAFSFVATHDFREVSPQRNQDAFQVWFRQTRVPLNGSVEIGSRASWSKFVGRHLGSSHMEEIFCKAILIVSFDSLSRCHLGKRGCHMT